jgi:hypothetical protein
MAMATQRLLKWVLAIAAIVATAAAIVPGGTPPAVKVFTPTSRR